MFDELGEGISHTIYSGLVCRKCFDASHQMFFPVRKWDMEPKEYQMDQILKG